MDDQKRSLPKPPKAAFRAKAASGENDNRPLMADEIARAAAEGRLDEFMSQELPDSEYARGLVRMMLGMSGMAGMVPADAPAEGGKSSSEEGPRPQGSEAPAPSDEVLHAADAGDVARLTELLRKEHAKRTGPPSAAKEDRESAQELSSPEREAIEGLISIASDNGLTLDWVILRALKLYVEEYRRNGRL